jgi:hypothetical protein
MYVDDDFIRSKQGCAINAMVSTILFVAPKLHNNAQIQNHPSL